ncbi:hypothetical protein C2R22_11670 [Salinigranum rubrum]|uniref:Uncharacterized protein n=2 Tax=Salinigranum rubrum TaxID=755307 RepID=A0A2I8VPY5_9EURY|nr:hypothetical protein C2R22_11670 [Salinigranum rubrum]
MLAVFLLGAGLSLARNGALTTRTASLALLSGLFGLVVFQFTVGNVWGYAVEYYNAGGRWTDLPFLVPFVAAGLAGAVVALRFESLAAGAWTAFWTFVVVAGLVAITAWMAVGYRDVAE